MENNDFNPNGENKNEDNIDLQANESKNDTFEEKLTGESSINPVAEEPNETAPEAWVNQLKQIPIQ